MKKILILAVVCCCTLSISAKKAPLPTSPWDKIVTVSGDANSWCMVKKSPTFKFIFDYQEAVQVKWTSDKKTGEWSTEVVGKLMEVNKPDFIDYCFGHVSKMYAPALKFYGFLPHLTAQEDAAADYEVRCRIDTIDKGNAAECLYLAGGVLSSDEKQKKGGAIVSGWVTITNTATGEEVCQLQMIRTRGVGYGIGEFQQRIGGLYVNMVIVRHCCKRDPLSFKPLKEK